MIDWAMQLLYALRDVGQHFTTNVYLAGFFIRQHTLRRRKDGDPEAILYTGNRVGAHVLAKARPRYSSQRLDGRLPFRIVLHVDTDEALLTIINVQIVPDVPFIEENLRHGSLQLRRRDIYMTVVRHLRIPNARKKVCYGIRNCTHFNDCFGPRVLLMVVFVFARPKRTKWPFPATSLPYAHRGSCLPAPYRGMRYARCRNDA